MRMMNERILVECAHECSVEGFYVECQKILLPEGLIEHLQNSIVSHIKHFYQVYHNDISISSEGYKV